MSLPGLHKHDEMDFPKTVKDSVTTLPFFSGDTTQLGTTAIPQDLVLVSALRRFENKTFIAEGLHTAAGNAAVLTDSTGDFLNWGVEVGDTVFNDTDSSSTTITAVTATTITGVLAGGTDDDWDTSDVYHVNKAVSHQAAKAEEIRKIRIITDQECYIRFDGEASATRHDIHLNAGDSFNEDNIRIISRISFINVQSTETPTLRWTVYGV